MGYIEPVELITKKGRRVTLRTAQPEDGEKVLQYTKQVLTEAPFLVTAPEEFQVSAEEEKSFLADILDSSGRLALLAECKGRVAGFLDFHNGTRIRTRHTGNFGMSTDADFRGEGIGRGLAEELCRWAEANPLIEKINLEVLTENKAARNLYKSIGFTTEGRQKKAVKINTAYYDMELMTRFTNEGTSRRS